VHHDGGQPRTGRDRGADLALYAVGDRLAVDVEPAHGPGVEGDLAHRLSDSPPQLILQVVDGRHVERLVLEALDSGRLAFEIAALQVDLRRQVDELDASRARVAAIADQERHRLARDLHDGAQQRLVTVGLTLRHVQHTLDGSAPEAIHDLDEAVGELAHAIDDLRELAGGLRPSSLDHGLRAALDDLASRTPTPVRLDVTTERFTPAIETAAYFIAAEGLTNAVKHAQARRIVLASPTTPATSWSPSTMTEWAGRTSAGEPGCSASPTAPAHTAAPWRSRLVQERARA